MDAYVRYKCLDLLNTEYHNTWIYEQEGYSGGPFYQEGLQLKRSAKVWVNDRRIAISLIHSGMGIRSFVTQNSIDCTIPKYYAFSNPTLIRNHHFTVL